MLLHGFSVRVLNFSEGQSTLALQVNQRILLQFNLLNYCFFKL